MPTNIHNLTTAELIDTLLGLTDYTFSKEELAEELKDRIIPESYEVEELRGGVRPLHSPI